MREVHFNKAARTQQPRSPHRTTLIITGPLVRAGFPGGSVERILLRMQETWVRSLDREDALEVEMATHSNIVAWRSPWTGEPGGLIVHRLAKNQIQLSG